MEKEDAPPVSPPPVSSPHVKAEAPAVKPKAAAGAPALWDASKFACFRTVLKEPINDPRVVLFVTTLGLAALALC